MAIPDVQLRIYENRILVDQKGFTGSGASPFQVLSGSRLLLVLRVDRIDPGAQINCVLENSLDGTFPVSLGTFSANAVGPIRQIYTDFNNLFNLRYTVTGGTADFKVGVNLVDNAINTTIANADVHVELSAMVDTDGKYSSVRVSDGVNELKVNPDGSINVNEALASNETPASAYNEITTVPAGIDSTLLSYTVPIGKLGYLYKVVASGENIAKFTLRVNGDTIAVQRTYFGGALNTTFDFTTPSKQTVILQPGDIVELDVVHNRPFTGDFEARAQLLLKDAP